MQADDQATYTSSNLRKHTSGNPLQRYLLNRFHGTIAQLLAPLRPSRILDAGCGEGFAMRDLLGAQHMPVIGVDGSPGALTIAHQLNPHRSFTAGDLYGLPFPSRSFDLVVCMEVLEHLEQPERGLAELCRVSSGWLLLSVPNEPLFRGANFLRGKHLPAWGNDPGHLNHWSARGFVGFIQPYCQIDSWRTSFPWTIALCRVN